MTVTCYCYMQTPIGRLLLAGKDAGLEFIGFPEGKMAKPPQAGWQADAEPFVEVMHQLDAYFAGRLQTFRLKLALTGTPFQLSVWKALQGIPYGTTISYGELASRIGRPRAVRAVGGANGRNPIPIVIPCHRVIGGDGQLTGFGGGLPIKRALLELENRNRPRI
jgi:methylated-DNA-[protein]-cysteine S-methyltransferase